MAAQQADDTAISILNRDLLNAYKAEEEFWKQRSRQLWLSLGDTNTSYFHAATKGRRARNRISAIEDEAGNRVFEEDQIGKVIADYFNKIFTSTGTSAVEVVNRAIVPRISSETNVLLTTTPTREEIREAMFAIHPDKAPGPDGFSASFFQSNWEVVGPAITKEIQGFFESGALPFSINSTHIRLIPKIKSPKQVSDYRPIALCNVYYKTISKILSLRLKPILQNIVSENQSAFIPDRAIQHNVLITHEVLHYLKASGATVHSFMAVKTDISKAYDRLEWSFIRTVLERLGFDVTFVNWMMECVTTVSYSFLLNNEVSGSVHPQRGIRQGDPLSPYIFIICAEVLSGLCSTAQDTGSLPGIRVSQYGPKINHLLFADDTMIFTKTDPSSCTALVEILHSYEQASGQMINAQKSSISFSSKTPAEIRSRVKQQLGIDKEEGVGKYLGLPEFGRKKEPFCINR